jgi:hypothetical protein
LSAGTVVAATRNSFPSNGVARMNGDYPNEKVLGIGAGNRICGYPHVVSGFFDSKFSEIASFFRD